MLVIRVTMPDLSIWEVPAYVIAEDRSTFYAKKGGVQGSEDYNKVYKDEYDYIMSDHDELVDWMKSNMNWSDVKSLAVKVSSRPPLTADEFQEGWVNGPVSVVNV